MVHAPITPKKTPLFEEHVMLHGKLVEFAGWLLPVEYSSLRHEHLNVRNQVGLFDVSHMGEILVSGTSALETLQWLTTNDVSRLEPGQAHYTLLTNFSGGIVDDLIIYCLAKNRQYFLCVNASNIDKDFDWIRQNNRGAEVQNVSDHWAQIAIQGPNAQRLLNTALSMTSPTDFQCLKSFEHCTRPYQSDQIIVARTGYTGEDGFEIFVPFQNARRLWQKLLSEGQSLNVLPVGLGARDTLRTEMKYSLYGHEINDHTNPYEAGLGWVVKPMAKDFIGKDMILSERERGIQRRLVGFKLLDRGIPRSGFSLISFDNQEIGSVTSGTLSPSLNEAIGIGYVNTAYAKENCEFFVQIRGRNCKARVVLTPFIKKGSNEASAIFK